MSGFAKASSAFREHAIKVFGTSDVLSGPNSEAIKMEHTVGKAWAFSARPNNSQNELRGWALGDGRVITTQQNFGLLLEEVGLWATPPNVAQLPAAVTWSLGNFYNRPGDPVVKLGPDGAGTVTFVVDHQEAGGGGSIGPLEKVDVVITVAKDHSATVKLAKR